MNLQAYAPAPISPALLAQVVRRTARQPDRWLELVRYSPDRRWYARLEQHDEHEVWLLSWLPGQRTGFHDHGWSAGAFAVAMGCLTERAAPGGRPDWAGQMLPRGTVRSFGQAYVHDVRNESAHPAVSIHAYSPPLTSMRRFDLIAGGVLGVAAEDRSW